MRKVLVLFLLLIGTKLFPQAPQKISYQAVARDGSGNIVTTAIGIKFQIYQGSVSGTLVYEETHTATPSSAGIFTVHIGGGSVVSGNFSTINWGANSYFLQVSIDPNGGTSYSTVGANQLVSVPYALYANSAGSAPSPTLAFGSGVLSVGSNTVSIPTSGTYSAGTGIAINSGSIINTAPGQTVNLTGVGVSTVTGTHPNFTVDVAAPALTYNNSTKELTLTQGGSTSTATLSGTGTNTISIVGTGVANVTPAGAGSNFTVNVPSPIIIGQGGTTVMGVWPNFTISSTPSTSYIAGSGISITGNTISNTAPNQTVSLTGLGSTTVSGTYPNYSISTPVPTVMPVPVLVGAGITSVTTVANNYTINTPPVGMSYVPSTGILSYSPAPGLNTLNISPAVTFTNNILSIGSNTVIVPGTGLWVKSGSSTNLFNTADLVGIGTGVPASKLHVSDPTTKVTIEATTASALTSLDFKTNGGGTAAINKYGSSGRLAILSGGAYNMQFLNSIGGSFQFDEGVNTRMMIAPGGFVGIGGITPTARLEVSDAVSSGPTAIFSNTITGGVSGSVATFNNSGNRSVGNSGVIINNLVTKSGGSNSTKVGLEVNSTGSWGPATVNQPNVGLKVTASGADNNYALQLIDGSQGAGKVLTSDATGNSTWNFPLTPTKEGNFGSFFYLANSTNYTYNGATILTFTPAVSGTVVFHVNMNYNFDYSLPSQSFCGIHVNTTGVAPGISTPFTASVRAGIASGTTGAAYGDAVIAFSHSMSVTAGTVYYVWIGGKGVNFNQTTASIGSAKVIVTLHQSTGL